MLHRLSSCGVRSFNTTVAGAVRQSLRYASSSAKASPGFDLLSPVWTHGTDIVVEKASGSWLYGTDNKKYLDFTCGIGVTNLGHCHPRIVKAAQNQVGNIIHGQANIVVHKPLLQLAQKMTEIVKISDEDQFFFSNSGAEAIEASIKLARHATKKTNIITFEGSFHGRTVGTMSLTNSKTIYKIGYQPLMSGVSVAPFAYCYHCPCSPKKQDGTYIPEGTEGGTCCLHPLQQLKDLLKMQSAPEETAAIIVEPVLGEGGYVPAPYEFMRGLRKICDENNILLICDEVQTGFGRTGKWFAFQHYDINPDILVMAKGIANGFPLSGIVARKELQSKWKPGSHGGTYGGNAVSCAAAVEVINVMKEENVLQHANEQGKRLMQKLKGLQAQHPKLIGDVRGKGLMIGVEFVKDAPKGIASKVANTCIDNGMLILTASAFETIRFIPPLNATAEEIDLGFSIFEKAVQQHKL